MLDNVFKCGIALADLQRFLPASVEAQRDAYKDFWQDSMKQNL